MTHSIYNHADQTEITIEGLSDFVTINIFESKDKMNVTYYLSKKQLHDLIGILLHIQSKMRK